MKPLFSNPNEIEKSVKQKYAFPPFIMMENAASALADEITKAFASGGYDDVLIVCGKGNNGADGLATARKLYQKLPVKVCCLGNAAEDNVKDCLGNVTEDNVKGCLGNAAEDKMNEAAVQFQMASKIGVPFISKDELKSIVQNKPRKHIIVDCIFGTGFHGKLSDSDAKIIDLMNEANGFKIACDIPSGLRFKADLTVTMGTLKTALYSDEAKDFCGKIVLAELGIAESVFEKDAMPDAYLLEECDTKLPFRTERKTHKGKFGHAVIVAGEKSGAGIMAAEAALSFGAGLVSILETPQSNLAQFKISPELMIMDDFPEKTTAVLIGSGLGGTLEKSQSVRLTETTKDNANVKNPTTEIVRDFIKWFKTTKNPACVIDADFFGLDFEKAELSQKSAQNSSENNSISDRHATLSEILSELNSVPNAKIVLTPHAKELCTIYEKCLSPVKTTVETVTSNGFTPNEILNHRIEIGKAFTKKYPNITLVMKGSNTFIASEGEIYIFDGGAQCLAKGGSGDVLAGMVTSLLAQGYSAKDAAITAVFRHGTAAGEFGTDAYNLTPRKLIELI